MERLATDALAGCRHSAHELVVRLIDAEDAAATLRRDAKEATR